MKTSVKSLLVATLTLTGAIFAMQRAEAQSFTEKEVTVPVSQVRVPSGFDSNTDAYVIVSGMFPNGCYRWNGAKVTDIDAFNHEVKSTALVSQGMCIMVLVPFLEDVSLGK